MPSDPAPTTNGDPAPDAEQDLVPIDVPSPSAGEPGTGFGHDRYQIGQPLEGARSQARDHVLGRTVEVAVADAAGAEALAGEARLLARLDHAGLPTVHDFVRSGTRALLVTRRVEGVTLAEAIVLARSGMPPAELGSPAAVVQVALKLCDALAAAHAHGVVHHRLAPEAILLGKHGQVVIRGWSGDVADSVRTATKRFVAGVERETGPDGLHNDIRGAAACIFQALAWQPPASGSDPLADLDPAVRQRFPDLLAGILCRALGSDATSGYRSMAEFGQALLGFQGGGAAAGRTSIWRRQGPFLRRRHTAWWLAGLAAVLVVAVLGAGPRLWSYVSWGDPVVQERFLDNTWRSRWIEAKPGMFTVANGRAVSAAENDAILIHRGRLTAPVAIEYTGEILNGSRPCDLSVWWSEGDGVLDDPARFQQAARSYQIQAASHDNTFCAIFQNPGRQRVAYSRVRFETGRAYRFRVELDGGHITMTVDGQRILDYHDPFPLSSGHIALYGFYPGKAFSDVRIYQKDIPRLVSPLAMGDAIFQIGRYQEAAAMYGRIVESDPDGPAAQLALFRKGLAERRLERDDLARRSWVQITDRDLAEQVAALRLEDLFATAQHDLLLERLDAQYGVRPAVREQLRRFWQSCVRRLTADPQRDVALLERYLTLRQRRFPEDEASANAAAEALVQLRRFAECLRSFPNEQRAVAASLLALGRPQEVLAAGWTSGQERMTALFMLGEYGRIADMPYVAGYFRAFALCKAGRAEEVAGTNPHPALLYLGRGQEILGIRTATKGVVQEALLSCGRIAEAAGPGVPEFPETGGFPAALLLQDRLPEAEAAAATTYPGIRFLVAAERGDAEALAELRKGIVMSPDLRMGNWFMPSVGLAVVDALRGDPQAPEQVIRPKLDLLANSYARTGWYVGRALLGEVPPEAVLEMPARSDAQAWMHLVSGIRAELQGRPAEALAAYRAFSALPWGQRLLSGNVPDNEVEWLVRWRLRALGGQEGKAP